MKKLAIILVVFCLYFPGIAMAKDICKYGEGDLKNIDGIMMERATRRPANGLGCTYRESAYMELPYKNGKLDGIVREYYENKKIKGELPCKNGKREGVAKIYYRNGKLKEETPYKKDKKEGMGRMYYENGKLQGDCTFKNDKKEGIVRIYYENGKLWVEFPVKNDKKEGYASVYTKNGKFCGKILYRNDKSVSGTCANGRALTNAEITKWLNGQAATCDKK